jgi:uncharacterized protein
MHLSVRSLSDGVDHFEKRYEPSLFPASEGDTFRVVSPVMLAFDVDGQVTGRHRVTGHLTGELELTCSRCLEPFTLPVATDFDLQYVPPPENTAEGEKEVDEEDFTTAFYSGDQIDLGHLVLEQLQLALPMKPLCAVACKGLCPHCGTNLNTGACECSEKWEDPRLAALRSLARPESKT